MAGKPVTVENETVIPVPQPREGDDLKVVAVRASELTKVYGIESAGARNNKAWHDLAEPGHVRCLHSLQLFAGHGGE